MKDIFINAIGRKICGGKMDNAGTGTPCSGIQHGSGTWGARTVPVALRAVRAGHADMGDSVCRLEGPDAVSRWGAGLCVPLLR